MSSSARLAVLFNIQHSECECPSNQSVIQHYSHLIAQRILLQQLMIFLCVMIFVRYVWIKPKRLTHITFLIQALHTLTQAYI